MDVDARDSMFNFFCSLHNSTWEKSDSLVEAKLICDGYEKLMKDVRNEYGDNHKYIAFVKYYFLIIAGVLNKDYKPTHHIKDDQVHEAIKRALYGTAVVIWPIGSRSKGLTYKTFWDQVRHAARGCKLLSELKPSLGQHTDEILLHNKSPTPLSP